jgi:hypothetical protein
MATTKRKPRAGRFMGCHASRPPFLPILGINYLMTRVARDDLRKMIQTKAAPGIQEAGKNPLFWKEIPEFSDLRSSAVPTARLKISSHRRPSLVLRLEPVQQLLEGFFSCPTGHRHGLKIDRRLLYWVSFSGTINLPPPRVRRRCPALHGD